MKTEIVKVNPVSPEPEAIRRAAQLVRSGQLVAFPTETVYGVGGNALDPEAAARLYEAKGRPAGNPLPVLISDPGQVPSLVADLAPEAERLIEAFFPGPLTLVLRAAPSVPEIVTAGTGNVGIRMPDHPIALAVIRESGMPLTTSSANLSGLPSPTTAREVLDQLEGRIAMLLDGGPTTIGTASTVLDLTGESPRILRQGVITEAMLRPYLESAP